MLLNLIRVMVLYKCLQGYFFLFQIEEVFMKNIILLRNIPNESKSTSFGHEKIIEENFSELIVKTSAYRDLLKKNSP